MNKTRTYYQPVEYITDGTNIAYGDIPSELYSFQAFATEEECRLWLSNNDYDDRDWCIEEYHGDDIEEVTIIDRYGDIVEVNDTDGDCTPITKDYYKDTPTSELFAIVASECQVETILSVAEGYIGEHKIREFLFACLGFDIE